MASARSSWKDLLERISPGSPQDYWFSVKDLRRIMQGPLKKFSRISTRARLCDNLPRNAAGQELENPAAQTLCEPAQSKCTNMLQEQFLGENLQEKYRGPRSGGPLKHIWNFCFLSLIGLLENSSPLADWCGLLWSTIAHTTPRRFQALEEDSFSRYNNGKPKKPKTKG